MCYLLFFSSRRRHTIFDCDWSSDVCSSDLPLSSRASVGTAEIPLSAACEDGYRWRKSRWLSRSSSSTATRWRGSCGALRSEEHTSELQSQSNLVCRLLLEKKKKYAPRRRRTSSSNAELYTSSTGWNNRCASFCQTTISPPSTHRARRSWFPAPKPLSTAHS